MALSARASGATLGRVGLIVGKIAIGAQVERVLVDVRAEQESRVRPHAVPDAELVEHVGVVDRDVGDDEVGAHQEAEHVLADVALLHDLRRRGACDADAASSAGWMSFASMASKSTPALRRRRAG